MSVRAGNPRRLILFPVAVSADGVITMPGTLSRARYNEMSAWVVIRSWETTVTCCGISRAGVGNFAPTVDLSTRKSPSRLASTVTLFRLAALPSGAPSSAAWTLDVVMQTAAENRQQTNGPAVIIFNPDRVCIARGKLFIK